MCRRDDRSLREYLQQEFAFEAAVRGLYKEMARITVTPSWARFYDFGAGRLPTFLRRLVEPGSA